MDSLNETFDAQSARLSALTNRVPGAVLALEVIGAAVAIGLLSLHISVLGRGLIAMLAAAALVTLLLLVTFDLDRPTRGLIKVPDTPLVAARASMALPPAADVAKGPVEGAVTEERYGEVDNLAVAEALEPEASSHGDDDFTLGVFLFQITEGLGHLAERIRPVDDRHDLAGLNELLERGQVFGLLLHGEQAELLALPVRFSQRPAHRIACRAWGRAGR